MAEDFFIGVDGGKSKTVCLLAQPDGTVIGTGRAGSSDRYDVPLDQAIEAVAACVKRAAGQAGVALPGLAGCFGLAGADWPEDFEELAAGITGRNLARQVIIKNDMHIALRAAADQGFGVVISAGTHTAAAIRTPDRQEWHSAWFSVEGSGGVTAGRMVLWAVLRAYDGRGEKTVLTDLVLAATNRPSPLVLLRELSLGKLDDAFMVTLAPLLFQAHFRHGDAVAARIIIRLGKEMARWATGLLARFDLLSQEVPVFLTGGLFKGEGSLLIDTITMAIHTRAPRAVLRRVRREPVIGALLYACEAAGQPVTAELLQAIERTAPGPEFYRTG